MTNQMIYAKITAVIDQFYKQNSKEYIQKTQLDYIGGVLQTALFLLPNERYFELKNYIYTTYGYDPGGCADRQVMIQDLMR